MHVELGDEIVVSSFPNEGIDQVQERVRREIARELHDRVAQSLSTMLLDLELFRREQHGRETVLRAIADLQLRTAAVLNEMRSVLYELRSTVTVDVRLAEDLRVQMADLERRYGVEVVVRASAEWPPQLPAYAGEQVRRIVREAAQNAVTHGGAGLISVRLEREGRQLAVVVADNGLGLRDLDGGLGVLGMRERALLLGGRLRIERTAQSGTTVTLTFPMPARSAR